MGSCLCKKRDVVGADRASRASQTSGEDSTLNLPPLFETEPMEELILEILNYVSSPHEITLEPVPLGRIHGVADTEEGWCFVMMCLIHTIPLYHPLAATAINVAFDVCPLPAHDTVVGFTRSLHLSSSACKQAYIHEESLRYARNLLVVLDCIVEKFDRANCMEILTQDMLEYLLTFLVDEFSPLLVLHSLISLEKLSVTAENRKMVDTALTHRFLHPLLPLELYHDSADFTWRQVGFCARWALDNTFMFPGRPMSFETVDMREIGVILNKHDASSYLKIGPDGLEARCDSHSFESVRATFEMNCGVWYYEVQVITSGVMQIGWASKQTSFESHDGFGVGDDPFSIAFDGCRRLIWHKAMPTVMETEVEQWAAGDIVGCFIDVGRAEAIFSLNGHRLPACKNLFFNTRLNGIQISADAYSEGFYPAASFMAHQQCRFNFGSSPFRYPPNDRKFQIMNNFGLLTMEERKVLPRHMEVDSLSLEEHPSELRCVICLNEQSQFGVSPCHHSGFCQHCATLLKECPLCRCEVYTYYLLPA